MKETRGQWERKREGVWEVGGLEDREVTYLQFLEQVSARKIASTFNQQHLRLTEREEIDLSKKVKPWFSFAVVFYNFLETKKKYSLRNEVGRRW